MVGSQRLKGHSSTGGDGELGWHHLAKGLGAIQGLSSNSKCLAALVHVCNSFPEIQLRLVNYVARTTHEVGI